ncbi:9649_t:CDS:2, partial [Racocetra fulgida]
MSDRILRCFGITQDPETNDYFLVSQYANDGDLNHYLRQNFVNIDWEQRLEILREIVKGLKDIHDANLVHHNLHGGNILRHIENSSSKYFIADFGFYFPSDATEKSLEICQGLRPDIIDGVPDRYIDLMNLCWDSNQNNRPDIDTILKFLSSKNDFSDAENFRQRSLSKSTQLDLDDSVKFPSSKLLDFINLPEPKNSVITLKSGISDLSLNSVDGPKISDSSENKPQ